MRKVSSDRFMGRATPRGKGRSNRTPGSLRFQNPQYHIEAHGAMVCKLSTGLVGQQGVNEAASSAMPKHRIENAIPGQRGGGTGCVCLILVSIDVGAQLKVGQVLIPDGECLLVIIVLADAALDGLYTTFCRAICLRLVGRVTSVINEVAYHAGMKVAR